MTHLIQSILLFLIALICNFIIIIFNDRNEYNVNYINNKTSAIQSSLLKSLNKISLPYINKINISLDQLIPDVFY